MGGVNNLTSMKQFLDAMSYKQVGLHEAGKKEGPYPFITISRQAGAGGHTLAKALLHAMENESDPLFHGWQMFDRELCEMVLKNSKLKGSVQSLRGEEYRSWMEELFHQLASTHSSQDLIVRKVFTIIRTLAAVGKVIIVGRAGSMVTKGLSRGMHLRLVAPEDSRVKRMMEQWNQSEKNARQTIRMWDTDRARLMRTYYHRDINDPLLYDAVWNTDDTPFEAIAAATIMVIKNKCVDMPDPLQEATAGAALASETAANGHD